MDDMFIATKDKSEIDRFKVQLNDEFEMKDLDVTKKILEIVIFKDWQAV